MNFIKQHQRLIGALVVVAAVAGILILANSTAPKTTDKNDTASAQKTAEEKKKAEAAEKAKQEAAKNYDYTAVSGDSYTVLARRSVMDYAKANDIKLSNAQIVAAETNLTVAAKSPLLMIGEKVSLKNASVKSAVDAATKLTKSQLAAWNVYAANVVF